MGNVHRHFSTRAMIVTALTLIAAVVLGAAAPPFAPRGTSAATAQSGLQYPIPPTSDQTDNYFGTEVADPYRPLEDTSAPATQDWVAAEASLSSRYLATIPGRPAIQRHYDTLLNYPRISVPFTRNGRYFYYMNDGTHRQNPLYTADSLDGTPWLLLDPDSFSRDGSVAISGTSVTLDGSMLAYALSTAGSDFREWHVISVATGVVLPDMLTDIRYSGVSWAHSDQGFYYTRWPQGGRQQVFYHQLGTDQSADLLIYDPTDHQDWFYGAGESDDGRYLFVSASPGGGADNELFYRDLWLGDSSFHTLVGTANAHYYFLGNDGSKLWFLSDRDGPRYAVDSVDLSEPTQWQTVIPQADDALENVSMAGDEFIAVYLHDAHHIVQLYAKDGSLTGSLPLPALGSLSGLGGPRAEMERFYQLTTFLSPGTIYRYDVATGATTVFRDPQTNVNTDDFTTDQLFYMSKDGTRVPMFVVHRKDVVLDGSNPTLMYGYGGFDQVEEPFYDSTIVAWLQMGGVFALPNIRGGGEYGEAWHAAGSVLNKQNSFDDFIAAAEYLIATGYTSPAKLAIWGQSNGGLLVGACLTQRPDLFGAVVGDSGLYDMLRYQLFDIGATWIPEYGSSADPTQFAALYAYSPLQNVHPGTVYPPTLIVAREDDNRVALQHSYKFVAALQAAQAGPAPILLSVVRQSGHGAGTPPLQQFLSNVDRLVFVAQALGVTPPTDW